MIRLRLLLVALMFWGVLPKTFAQNDPGAQDNKAVKKEVTEMMDKLNAYLNEHTPAPNDHYAQWSKEFALYKDSVALRFAQQQKEIEELRLLLLAAERKPELVPEVVTTKFENLVAVLYFEVGSYTLSDEYKALIKKLISENADKTLQLVSYTDWTGNAEANQVLSNQRAKTVQNELINNGFKMQQLKIYSRGQMAAENEKLPAKECRRVEIRY